MQVFIENNWSKGPKGIVGFYNFVKTQFYLTLPRVKVFFGHPGDNKNQGDKMIEYHWGVYFDIYQVIPL